MHRLVLLAYGWLIAPALACAGAAVPNARALGIAEAMLGYCAKADPAAVAQQQERIKELVGDASPEILGRGASQRRVPSGL